MGRNKLREIAEENECVHVVIARGDSVPDREGLGIGPHWVDPTDNEPGQACYQAKRTRGAN